jgi:hypothetical protein
MELTREQIKEGNDKLAKLLGWYQDEKQLSFGASELWWENSDCAKYVAYSMHNNYPHRDLPFHRDWNYLMKIVDKIGTLVYYREDDAPDYNWKLHYSYSELFHHMWNKWLRVEKAKKGEFNLMNDLTTIWSGCVAWVDWYYSEDNQKDE